MTKFNFRYFNIRSILNFTSKQTY